MQAAQYLSILQQVGIFSNSDESFLRSVTTVCEEIEMEKDEVLFHKGEMSTGLYIILDGCLKVHDRDYTLAEMSIGHIIGEYSLLDEQPRSASVTATCNSKLLYIEKEYFEDLITRQPHVLQGMLNIFTQRLREHNIREENQNKLHQEVTKIKDELAEQQEFIMMQGDKVSEQKVKITQSINYAKNIQKALLPASEELENIWPEHFVFFKPKDIVSGDFYWTFADERYKYIAAADCTGHGVPGAFMCMLGISALNQISLNIEGEPDVSEILWLLRKNVITTLHQKREFNSSKDGMDIGFCVYDTQEKRLQFSGAYNPMYLIRDGELIKYKANRMPIGVHINEHMPFEKHVVDIQEGDVIYIFSDGFPDQFGEKNGKKYSSKRFQQFLLSISHEEIHEQKVLVRKELKNWRGHLKQLDDIVIIGIRF